MRRRFCLLPEMRLWLMLYFCHLFGLMQSISFFNKNHGKCRMERIVHRIGKNLYTVRNQSRVVVNYLLIIFDRSSLLSHDANAFTGLHWNLLVVYAVQLANKRSWKVVVPFLTLQSRCSMKNLFRHCKCCQEARKAVRRVRAVCRNSRSKRLEPRIMKIVLPVGCVCR